MEKILLLSMILSHLLWAPQSFAENQIDPTIKNLSLVGVIHVAGLKAKGQSVAVLRDRLSGRTLLLRLGDTLLDGDFTVSELGPQKITLVGGDQNFVLRVERQDESTLSAAASDTYEAEEGNLNDEAENSELGESESAGSKDPGKTPVLRFEPKIIPEAACIGELCLIK